MQCHALTFGKYLGYLAIPAKFRALFRDKTSFKKIRNDILQKKLKILFKFTIILRKLQLLNLERCRS